MECHFHGLPDLGGQAAIELINHFLNLAGNPHLAWKAKFHPVGPRRNHFNGIWAWRRCERPLDGLQKFHRVDWLVEGKIGLFARSAQEKFWRSIRRYNQGLGAGFFW